MAEGRAEVSEEELQQQVNQIVERHLADRALIKRDDTRNVLLDLYKLYGNTARSAVTAVKNAIMNHYSILLLKEKRKLDICLMQVEFDNLGDYGGVAGAAGEALRQEETASAAKEKLSAYPVGLPLV